ncbi:MAG: enoyl-CoA hydratase/isomerase family protein [Ruminococcus sp.]|uniref:enoyl-CoA hydratase/isomerase family protein n=1 Tax=Ruminococcus sp. TaxID=41978 RepID=UPI0025F54A80|nr:enoyl-CoA hydratase/isomerase family protein [Ruminococcus sp.]MCR5540990.1 enoyl-CoA hydratase/isomerase family protein [Ruminococcus sp.]
MNSVLSEIHSEGSIAVLTIENGAKNLISEPEFIEREILLAWLEKNPQTKALVITGKGRHFSHGADVSLFYADNVRNISEKLKKGRELLNTIERLPIVTVAAVNGGCFGGGLEIAMSCRFRIASSKARLGLTEVVHGVVPGMGGIERLSRIIGAEKALQMILQGEMLSADKALSIGLVTKVTEEKDALPEAMRFAEDIVSSASVTQINAVINTMNRSFDGEPDPSFGAFEAALEEAFRK